MWKIQILYDLRFKKKNSKDACESDDQLRKDIENDKFYEALSKSKLDLRLDLDIQTFENQCYLVNLLLNENNLFFRVYELKDKFRYLIKQASKKVEKFNRFKIIRAKFDKKLRQSFRPVDILFEPVKKPDQLVNCFLSEKLNLVLRASCSDGPKSGKVKPSTAWQCYFCLNYYARKERYKTQILLTFEENSKLKVIYL